MSVGGTTDGLHPGQRCYILGAGFSRVCNLPLASELAAQVFAHAAQGVADWRPDVRDGWLSILKAAYPSCDFRDRKSVV